MKENCFVRFAIEGEDGIQYGIYNSTANVVVCACCGDFFPLDENITILETMGIGREVYDAIMDAFNGEKFWRELKRREAEIKKRLNRS